MSDKLSYDHVLFGGRPGTLRFGGEGLGWRETSGGKTYAVTPNEVKRISARLAARGYRLIVDLKNGTAMQFDGLPKRIDDLKRFLREFLQIDLEVVELGLKGVNWGEAEVRGTTLMFLQNTKEMFQIPLTQVSNATTAKNEVLLEFAHEAKAAGEELIDMRLYVPNVAQAEDQDDDAEEGDEERKPVSSNEILYQSIKDHLEGGQAMGEKIVVFDEVSCVHPRGRFSVELYSNFVRLHGSTFAHKIKYDSIASLFLLPNAKDRVKFLVIGLLVPLRQGQTQYQFLVFHISNDVDGGCEVNLPEAELARRKLKASFSDDEELSVVLAELLSGMSGRPLADLGKFSESSDAALRSAFVNCSFKANEGLLFPLDKQLVYLFKPPMVIRYNDIQSIEFSRVGASGAARSARSFDMKVTLASNGSVSTFGQIRREVYDHLSSFFKEKKINMTSFAMADEDGALGEDEDEEDDDEDEDDDDDDDDDDRRRAARKRSHGASNDAGDDLDDSESEDEDFNPDARSDDDGEGASGSGSGSSSSGSDDDEDEDEDDEDGGKAKKAKPAKKAKEPAPKKSRAEKKAPAKAKEPKAKAAKPRKSADGKTMMDDKIDDSDLDD